MQHSRASKRTLKQIVRGPIVANSPGYQLLTMIAQAAVAANLPDPNEQSNPDATEPFQVRQMGDVARDVKS
jgi:hypothetical protein